MSKCLLVLLAVLTVGPPVTAGQLLFDAHLHYDTEDTTDFSLKSIIEQLKDNGVRHALVTSIPASRAARLYRMEPQCIVPVLGVYEQYVDKEDWHRDRTIPRFVREALAEGPWRGIGELHLFAEHRHSPVLRKIVKLAVRYDVPLLMHADPAVIDTIYETAPNTKVIWAHAGTFPYPDLVADYLDRYSNLYIDLSMRDERIAPQGRIADAWYELFIRYPDRFLVGVDTYSTARWHNYADAIGTLRQWLSQLPDDIATRLAYENAHRLLLPAGE